MGTCLVTKLNAPYQGGSSLNELGFITLRDLETSQISLTVNEGCVIKSDDGTFNVGNNNNLTTFVATSDAQRVLVTPNTEGMSLKISKYKIHTITDFNNNGTVNNHYTLDDINDLRFVTNIIRCSNVNVSGDISKFNFADTLEQLALGGGNITGDITNFNVKNLTMLNLNKTNITGTINNFNVKNLTSLGFQDTGVEGIITNFDVKNLVQLFLSGTNVEGVITNFDIKNLKNISISGTEITGDLKAMCENAWNNGNGRTTGYIALNTFATGDISTKRMWGDKTPRQACEDAGLGNNGYNPYAVFSANGVSLSITKPA